MIPSAVFAAMFVAAWARAEHCPINIVDGHLELHCRYTPSDELEAAFARHRSLVTGAIGFAIPLLFNERNRAFAATWAETWGGHA